ncbi:hypothetical protein J2755_000450 [Methanohalophilus levihalophilus]|uniref:hypothetical protein n=1 Tax=Methanohalophilus levihalophilus TaxID=1431282 RepID=UPI001AEB0758|nr:hypothetical protein [Methanohalophilus levihalophilus]MBP2029530.1 hypothetical protein [Methanohalophilus levihalophilus]
MEDYFGNIVFGAVDPRLLSIMIITGFLIFFMYFYNSELWKTFSDFDKLSFSIVCGFIVFMGLVVPLARIIFAMEYFITGYDFGKIESDEIVNTYKQIYYWILIGLFIGAFASAKPLYENIKVVKSIFIAYFLSICFLILFVVELAVAIYFSSFRAYMFNVINNIVMSIFFLCIFFFVYLAIHKASMKVIIEEIGLFFSNLKLKNPHLVLLGVVLIILPISTGVFLFSYEVTENEEKIDLISIEEIDIRRYEVSPAKEVIFRDYSIKMPIAVSWAKVHPDLPLKSDFDSESNLKYVIVEEQNTFLVNDTSKVVNVTVTLYNYTEVSFPKMVTFDEPMFTNDSMFTNISLNNYLPHNIEIEVLTIPIPNGYSLEEKDFVKTQHFSNHRGGIQGYSIRDEDLFLTYVRLEKNSSGTIMLKLVNTTTETP